MRALRKLILFVSITVSCSHAVAVELTSSKIEMARTAVNRIDRAESIGEVDLVYLNSGRVLRLIPTDENAALLNANLAQSPIEIQIEDRGSFDTIESIRELNFDNGIKGGGPPDHSPGASTDPTPDGIFKFMKSMNLKKGSQCFHRAYLWAYDTFTFQGLMTEKAFLFFSRKYIQEYRYKWWFHVAPMVPTSQGAMILDPWFMRGPSNVKRWTDEFMENKATCPVIPKYLGHANHGQNDWCFLRLTNMYYYHPNSVERADREGRIETTFDLDGLIYAEKSARRN